MRDVLAQAEAQLSIQQRFRIAVARSMRLLAKKEPFDESKHPRVQGGEHGGEFTSTGGGTDVAEKPPAQKPAHAPEPEPGHRLTSNAIIAEAGDVKSNSKRVQDVAKEINERAGKIIKEDLGLASIDLDNRTDETDDYVAGVIAQELRDGLSNGKSAADWYDSSMKEAMSIADKLYPGMAKDPDQRFAYTAALAISSQGEVVESTVRLADQAYRHFAEHGRFPTDIQAADPNIVLNLKKVNAFIDKLGVAKTREMFDQQFTVRDLKKATGIGVSGMGMDDMVYGSAVLGPKIGQGFYQNLNGNFSPITMDMWFMRAWGRVTNTGIGTPDMEPMYARLDAALAADGRKVPRSEASKKTLAREINAQHEKDYQEHKADYKSGKRKKTELAYASERIVLSADGAMVEQPRGVAHRRWMTSVFHRALDKLNAEGVRISPASGQATWWWPEQVLYDAMGARVRETDMDYGKALRKLADSRGLKQFNYRKGLGFVPWIDDPDPPDYMTDDEIAAMAERAARYFGVSEKQLNRDAHSDWMDECVPELMSYGKDQTVAIAACLNMWRDAWEESHPDGADDPGPDRPDRDERQLQTAQALLKAWDESEHPRVPAGGPDGGQFGHGGGSSSKPGKGKGKKVKKEDFDKAKIKLDVTSDQQNAFVEKWNDKVGEDPAEFKKGFMGGLDGDMSIGISGARLMISGNIQENGKEVGTFNREVNPDNKRAYSAYFALNKAARGADIGKKLLAGNVETYRELGIETVGVNANIDVGGYAWAKYGYVPTQDAWNSLRDRLERKVSGDRSPMRGSSTDTYEADDWNMLSSDRQDDVRDAWMRSSYSEFLQSEEQNWRDSGQAKNDVKIELADQFKQYDSIPGWANGALDGARKYFEEKGEPPIPYTNKQLFDAIELEFESRNGDGEDDPEITFDDDLLKEPEGYDPAQGTLPGIEPIDPASYLTEDMRERIEKRMIAAFDQEAESQASDMDPPTYIADSVAEYQEEYWDQKDDAEKLRHAVDLGLADIEIEREDEEEEQPELEGLNEPEEDALLKAIHDRDPKSIWKVADDPRGKDLLLGTDWVGNLNLTDPEAMKRFNDYVGRVKHG